MAYNKRVWGSDEVITKEALNNIENGIEAVEQSIPKKTSQLENDSGFITEHLDLSNYAEKDELHEHKNKDILDGINLVRMQAWDNAASGGNINLDNYVSKETFEEFVNNSIEHIFITEAEYEALSEEDKNKEDVLYLITDGENVVINLDDYALKSEIPVIPEPLTKVSELENDLGYLTEDNIPLQVIPSNLSEFNNDTNFITIEDVLACLITEEEKQEMDNRVKALEEVEHVSLEQYNALLDRIVLLEEALAALKQEEPTPEEPLDPEEPTE